MTAFAIAHAAAFTFTVENAVPFLGYLIPVTAAFVWFANKKVAGPPS